MIGIRVTNCRGEVFFISNSFFPPSSLHQATQVTAQQSQMKSFLSPFCVEYFLATLSDIELQAICHQLTHRGQLDRQLLEEALLDGELKVHPVGPLSDLHLNDTPASTRTDNNASEHARGRQTEQRSLITLRAEIKTTLRQMLDQERYQALQLEKQYQQKSSYQKSLAHLNRFASGLYRSGISFLTWLKDVHDVINMNQRLLRIIKAAMAAEADNQGQRYQVFKQTLAESEKKELVEALGFDPSTISVDQLKHIYALANLVYEDPLTRLILVQFVKDYADAQHSLEWSEFSGGAAFEVILTALLALVTGGAGAIASLGTQARKMGQLKKLGTLLSELAEQLKDIPKDKPVSFRQLKEVEDKKAQKAQKPAEKPAFKPSSGDDGKMRKEIVAPNKVDDNVTAPSVKKVKEHYGTNEATWTIDDSGKPISVDAKLDSTYNTKRSSDEKDLQGKVGGSARLDDDDGGHLVGHRFMSDQGEKNLFPQNSNLNRSAYKKMENEWADWTDEGFEVKLRLELDPPGADRPDFLYADYDVIDPSTGNTVFKRSHEFSNQSGSSFNRINKRDMQKYGG